MLERRISYARDKADIIKRLIVAEDTTGPFSLIADVLVFAAALGLSRNRRVRIIESPAEPIRQSVFDRQGYDTMMNLLALHADPRPDVLGDSDQAVDERARAFEEFANGGLEILQEELRGKGDVLESVVLLISAERRQEVGVSEVFDLSKLVS